jgi:hypothetical protein
MTTAETGRHRVVSVGGLVCRARRRQALAHRDEARGDDATTSLHGDAM